MESAICRQFRSRRSQTIAEVEMIAVVVPEVVVVLVTDTE
jgi:hypothetical protein